MSNWGFNLLVALTFLLLVERLGPGGTFWLYAAISVACFLFAYWFVPRNKRPHTQGDERALAALAIAVRLPNRTA